MKLRLWQSTDASALLELVETSTDLERQMPLPGTLQEAQHLIEGQWLPAQGRAVFCLDDGQAVGLVGITYSAQQEDGSWDRGWVYYWIADRARCKGILKSAVRAVCDWALGSQSPPDEKHPRLDTELLGTLESPNLRRLELGYRTNNPASGAVARYAGFTVEGIERQKFLYLGQTYDAVLAVRLRQLPAPDFSTGVAVHHIELWTQNLEQVRGSWDWVLTQLGFSSYQQWQGGQSWQAQDGSYIVLEQSPQVSGAHQRTRAGLNHLALTCPSAHKLDSLRDQAAEHGWSELFAPNYPHAGGPQHYALYLENTQGFELEIVAPQPQ
ncbi:GNAT family N-acetyltransferase [Rothia sp. P5766]|uniref:GNAT family N-acetyltransferase n=1 Tax=Rothia sp. P5766 TaxID=3402656 RepID=UPI003ADCDAB5